jgi:hypothetical protein
MNICLFCFGWKKLPSYPHPVMAPGVAFSEDHVVVIGGFDIIAGITINIIIINFIH